jgi:hypothetical protein
MAKGDITIFQKFRERLGDGQINLSSDVIKCALTNHTVASPPGGGAAATDPRWGAAGTEDLSTNECTPGGGYSAGGTAIDGGDPWALSGGVGTYTAQNATFTSAGSGDPTDVRFGVLYIDDANKYALGYVQVYDGATDASLLDGDILVKWNSGATQGTLVTL